MGTWLARRASNPRPPPSPTRPPPRAQSDVYLFSALVWHERLIYPDETQPAEPSKLAERFAKLWPGRKH